MVELYWTEYKKVVALRPERLKRKCKLLEKTKWSEMILNRRDVGKKSGEDRSSRFIEGWKEIEVKL